MFFVELNKHCIANGLYQVRIMAHQLSDESGQHVFECVECCIPLAERKVQDISVAFSFCSLLIKGVEELLAGLLQGMIARDIQDVCAA